MILTPKIRNGPRPQPRDTPRRSVRPLLSKGGIIYPILTDRKPARAANSRTWDGVMARAVAMRRWRGTIHVRRGNKRGLRSAPINFTGWVSKGNRRLGT